MSENSNKPINPVVTPQYGSICSEGLTKREYFAGLVIQGLLANKPPHKDGSYYGAGEAATKVNIKNFVEHGISIADELLKQLDTRK